MSASSYEEWFARFGRTTNDPELIEALAAAGVTQPLTVKRSSTDCRTELDGGIMLVFKSAALYPDSKKQHKASVGVLAQYTLFLEAYEGPLPFGIDRKDTQATLRARLGPSYDPNEDEDSTRDNWEKDGLRLHISYEDGRGPIKSISVIKEPG